LALSDETNDTAVPGWVASGGIGYVEGERCRGAFLDAVGEQTLSPSQGHQPVGRRQTHYHQQHHYNPTYKRDHLQEDEREYNKAMPVRQSSPKRYCEIRI